jgi:hypothetical protein
MRRIFTPAAALIFACLTIPAVIAQQREAAKLPPPDKDGWIALFNGRDLTAWKFKHPEAKKVWIACNGVKLDPNDPARLVPDDSADGPPALLCGDDGRGSDLLTEHDFYNYELHIEFTVPKGSNSGIYNRGLYEIQVFDSYGKDELGFHDCGGLYERAKPARNLSKPPGEWQTFDIKMQGRKLSLKWNGVDVYKDHDVRYGETDKDAFERLTGENANQPPELRVKLQEKDGRYLGYFGNGGTRASLPGVDRPGPILLQGDHGPVAYRNIKIRPLAKK